MMYYFSITSKMWNGHSYTAEVPEMGYQLEQDEIPLPDAEGYVRDVILGDKGIDELRMISLLDAGDTLYTVRLYCDGEEILYGYAWLSMTAFDMICEKEEIA